MKFSHPNINPCLFSKGFEFVAVADNKVKALHDEHVLSFDQLPSATYALIKSLMKQADASMSDMERFVFNRWGGLDNVPDIDEKGNPSDPEYLADVTPALYDNGKVISPAELRVLQLITCDDKTIAVKLFISPYTVARHFSALYFNSGMNRRAELTEWAKNKGII